MTVCVGAFAAKSQAIVLVADKSITYNSTSLVSMQWDTSVKKIMPIGNSGWRALVAGNVNFASEVLQKASDLLAQSPADAQSCWTAMDHVKTAYRTVRDAHIEDSIIKPHLLTRDLLFSRSSSLAPLDTSTTDTLNSAIQNFRVDCSLLICGFDEYREPHMFLVSEPGEAWNYDPIGFHAIGIGAEVAIGKLLCEEAKRDDSLEEVLYKAFEAKANAEIVSGVGYEWDAEIITAGNELHVVPEKIQKIMDQLFHVHSAGPFASVEDDDAPPRTWKSTLRKYSQSVLAAQSADT